MKRIVCGATLALLVVTFALPALTYAGANGPSATGNFQFTLEDGQSRFLEFNAREQNNGRVIGEMTFSDPSVVAVEDPDATPGPNNAGALVQAQFDCLKITGNRAVMSGVISQSNILSAVGLRVLLVVEDNGEGINAASTDKLTWGIYQAPPAKPWIPVDAEDPNDRGAFLTWTATDAERKDDVGIPMPPNPLVQCKTFPGAAYDFPEIKYAGGDLQVRTRQ